MNLQLLQHLKPNFAAIDATQIDIGVAVFSLRVFFEIVEFLEPSLASRKVAWEHRQVHVSATVSIEQASLSESLSTQITMILLLG